MPSKLNAHEEFLRKKRNKKLFRWGLIIFLILFLVGLVSYISHRPRIRISKIEVVGTVAISESDISSASLQYIQGSYLWLFPRNNFLLYPRTGLEKYLKANFERIDTINIHETNFNTLVVTITERTPVGVWCDTLPTKTATSLATTSTTTIAANVQNGNCYLMDSNSLVFASAPNASGNTYFTYYGLFGTTTPIGNEYLASTTEFTDINQFTDAVRGLSLSPEYIVGNTDGDFTLVLASGVEIYFNTNETPTELSQNLQALLQTPALSQSMSSLNYIDLRFGNKLYYKLK